MEPQRHDIELPRGRVSCLEWDGAPAADGRSVLLLHGGGLDSAWLSWALLGPALAEAGYRVLAPDHPGYGHSPRASRATTQERLVGYVGEVAEALALRRYAVGGLSLGGGMAIGHVLARPARVSGAILLGSYGLMDHQFAGRLGLPAHVLTWAMLRTGIISALLRAYGNHRGLMKHSVRAIVRSAEQRTPELLDAIMDEAERGAGFTPFGEWQRDQFRWNRLRTNYTAVLDRISVPALIVHGDHDTGVPVANAVRAAGRIPDARLCVVSDAGHWVQRDRPDIVGRAVRDFLDGLDWRATVS